MVCFVNKVVKIFFAILLTIITFGLLYRMILTLLKDELVSMIVASAGIVIAFVLFVLIIPKAEGLFNRVKEALSKISALNMAMVLAVICLVTKITLVFVFHCDCTSHTDMRQYLSFATQIVQEGSITEGIQYAQLYPYTLVFSVVLSPLAFLFGMNSVGYEVVFSILITVVMVLLFDILRKFVGKEQAFLAILLYNLLPPGLLQPQVIIHETPLLFCTVTALWFVLKVFDSSSFVLKICSGLIAFALIVIGAGVNVSGLVVAFAFAIFITIKIISASKKSKKTLFSVCGILLVIVLLASVFLCQNLVVDMCAEKLLPDNLDEIYVVPYGWQLYLGANFEESATFNHEDADTYNKYLEYSTKEDAYNYQLTLIKDRYDEYVQNPWRIPIHIINKLILLWSPYFPYNSVPYNPGYQWLIFTGHGIIQKALFACAYLGYSMINFASLLGLFGKKKNDNPAVNATLFFMLVSIGVSMALMPFEVSAKYSTIMQVFLFCVFAVNFGSFRNNMCRIHTRLSKKDR